MNFQTEDRLVEMIIDAEGEGIRDDGIDLFLSLSREDQTRFLYRQTRRAEEYRPTMLDGVITSTIHLPDTIIGPQSWTTRLKLIAGGVIVIRHLLQWEDETMSYGHSLTAKAPGWPGLRPVVAWLIKFFTPEALSVTEDIQ